MIKELSLGSPVKIEKTVLAKLFKDPATISDLIRKLGLSDALLHSLQKAPPARDRVSDQHKLDAQWREIARPKIQNPGNYELAEEGASVKYPKSKIAEPQQQSAHSQDQVDLGIVQPFLPTQEDFKNTIDDLSTVLNNSENYRKTHAFNNPSENTEPQHPIRIGLSLTILVAACCVILVSFLWMFF